MAGLGAVTNTGVMGGAGDNSSGFFRQMATRRIGARRPSPPRPGGIGGIGAPPMPAPGVENTPPPPPPQGQPPVGMPPAGMMPPGSNYGGGEGMNNPGAAGMMFNMLPQGTEEAFGAAPPRFNQTLRRPPQGLPPQGAPPSQGFF